MPQLIAQPMQSLLTELEHYRNSRVLVLSASQLDMGLLPKLYEQLLAIGQTKRLDVVLQCHGGEVNAARRIALLLREFTTHLSVIVPYYCQSAATLLTLAADEIVAGPMAVFSPLDPHLAGNTDAEGGTSALSCQDIKQFNQMARDWFDINIDENKVELLSMLCGSIFPPTLTAFYRTALELKQIAAELLQHQLPTVDTAARSAIIEKLMFGYHSHSYAMTRDELKQLGLQLATVPDIDTLVWQMSVNIQQQVGGALRQSADQPWQDVLLVSRDLRHSRLQNENGMAQWTQGNSE